MYTLGPVHVELDVSAIRLWAAVKDMKEVLPKVLPLMRASVEFEEGDGSEGSIRIIRFPAVSSRIFAIERIDLLDDDTFTEVYTLVGGEIEKHYSYYRSTRTLIPMGPNSTIASLHVEYVPYDDCGPPESSQQMFVAVIKALEAYLNSNDDYS